MINHQHLRGLVIEGLSHTGKTSTSKEIKKLHSHSDNERSLISLGEHYTQILHSKGGKTFKLGKEDHYNLLKTKLDFLNSLGDWGDYLGHASNRSRGIFFLFERFHINHKNHFSASNTTDLEEQLISCHAKTLLLTISENAIVDRLKTREKTASHSELEQMVDSFIIEQNEYIRLCKKSRIPTLIINTDAMAWSDYAREALEFAGVRI